MADCKRTFKSMAIELKVAEKDYLLLRWKKIRTFRDLASITSDDVDIRFLLKWMATRGAWIPEDESGEKASDTVEIWVVPQADEKQGATAEEIREVQEEFFTDPEGGGAVRQLIKTAHIRLDDDLKKTTLGLKVVRIDPIMRRSYMDDFMDRYPTEPDPDRSPETCPAIPTLELHATMKLPANYWRYKTWDLYVNVRDYLRQQAGSGEKTRAEKLCISIENGELSGTWTTKEVGRKQGIEQLLDLQELFKTMQLVNGILDIAPMGDYKGLHDSYWKALRQEVPKGFRGPTLREIRVLDEYLHNAWFEVANARGTPWAWELERYMKGDGPEKCDAMRDEYLKIVRADTPERGRLQPQEKQPGSSGLVADPKKPTKSEMTKLRKAGKCLQCKKGPEAHTSGTFCNGSPLPAKKNGGNGGFQGGGPGKGLQTGGAKLGKGNPPPYMAIQNGPPPAVGGKTRGAKGVPQWMHGASLWVDGVRTCFDCHSPGGDICAYGADGCYMSHRCPKFIAVAGGGQRVCGGDHRLSDCPGPDPAPGAANAAAAAVPKAPGKGYRMVGAWDRKGKKGVKGATAGGAAAAAAVGAGGAAGAVV